MNQRIRQLAEQAGFDPHHAEYDTCIRQFAELIVRECADLINSMDHSSQYFPHVADAIKEHFGFEE
jgi:hypothetical protein